MASPPGPLVDADGLQGWRGRDRSLPHQAEQGGRTGREPQAGGEPGPCLPTEGHADRSESRDRAGGFCGHMRRQGLAGAP